MTDSSVWSRSSDETEAAGRDLARAVRPGEAVLVAGDLGAGKTILVRGLAAGLGCDPAEVTSPTFALVHEYGPADGTGPRLVHVDRYRIRGRVEDLGLEDPRYGPAVVAIEWPLPEDRERPGWDVTLELADAGTRLIRIRRRTGR